MYNLESLLQPTVPSGNVALGRQKDSGLRSVTQMSSASILSVGNSRYLLSVNCCMSVTIAVQRFRVKAVIGNRRQWV